MTRVLILSASAGSGHLSAAAAIEQRLNKLDAVSDVYNLDALDFTSDAYRTLYSDLYFRLVKRAPWLVGLQYELNDAPFREPQLLKLVDRLNAEPLVATIRELAPEITVCTHFMPAKIISLLLARGEIDTRLSIVTTDYDFQGMWLSSLFHRYFVAAEETRAHLVRLGIPAERVVISGIPVNPIFAEPVDREAVLARYQLDPALPVVLISAGAAGGNYAIQIVAQTMAIETPFQAVVVCGKNDDLWREIGVLIAPQAKRFRVLGYTSDMPDLMRIASLFVGKPGGLSASECMAAGLPMVIINPIPGQEERNSDHLLEHGAAVRCNYRTTIGYKIDSLLSNPERLARMREAAIRIGKPNAADHVATAVLDDILEPFEIDEESQKRILSLATEGFSPTYEPMTDPIALYLDQSGRLLGTLSEAQFEQLREHLVEEHVDDQDYDINPATVAMLQERQIDPEVLAMLESAMIDEEDVTIRWVRRH